MFKRIVAALLTLKYFLRSIGLELINTLLRPVAAAEPPKFVLRRSRWIAFSRSIVHIFPVLIFAFLCFLNYRTWYLGPGISDGYADAFVLAILQVAAKVLEIICVASLTAVVVQILRSRLIADGLPLGMVGAGMYFSQANYFWSPEILGGLLQCTSWRNAFHLIVIGAAAGLALLIGPSSAVLLLPRNEVMPSGGTFYSLPATADQLWPLRLSGAELPPECFTSSATQYLPCPSAGIDHLQLFFKYFLYSFQVDVGRVGVTIPIRIPVGGQYPILLNYGNLQGYSRETTIRQPSAITALVQGALNQDWSNSVAAWEGSPFGPQHQYKYAGNTVSSVSTKIPMVSVRCSQAQNISSSQPMATFPIRKWGRPDYDTKDRKTANGSYFWNTDTDGKPVNVSRLIPDLTGGLHVKWVTLPMDQFGPLSGGVLISFPGTLSQKSLLTVACSIAASWQNETIFSDSTSNNGAWDFESGSIILNTGINRNYSAINSLNVPITIDEDWFLALNAPLANTALSNASEQVTTLESLLSTCRFHHAISDLRNVPQSRIEPSNGTCSLLPPPPNATDVELWNDVSCGKMQKTYFMTWLLAAFFVDGLSRQGMQYAMDPSTINMADNVFSASLLAPNKSSTYEEGLISLHPQENPILPPPPGSGFVTQRMQMQVVGYAFRASSTTDFIVAAVVALYAVVALAFALWQAAFAGVSGTSWDTVTELLALALKSPALPGLGGVGAGVERLGTYRRPVKVRAVFREFEGRADGGGSVLRGGAREEDDGVGSRALVGSAVAGELAFVVGVGEDEEEKKMEVEESGGEMNRTRLEGESSTSQSSPSEVNAISDAWHSDRQGRGYEQVAIDQKYL